MGLTGKITGQQATNLKFNAPANQKDKEMKDIITCKEINHHMKAKNKRPRPFNLL